MRGFFYSRLSLKNISTNKRVFAPYIMVASFMVMVFCLILNVEVFLKSGSFGYGARSLATLFDAIRKVMYLFVLVVLIYTNSFVMRQRFKELGLYSILGMNKLKLSRLMILDSLFVYFISMLAGSFLALCFSKLSVHMFTKLAGFKAASSIGVGLGLETLLVTGAFFLVVFILSTLLNLARMVFLKPLNIMKIQSVGEKEPKGNILLGLLGLILLAVGYYLALKDSTIFQAFQLFFPAVLCVVIGTYLSFVAFSIVLLKFLKKRKAYYYRSKNFLNVSTMLYRMKKNAVGLANICLLSTMVLVTVSGSVALYSSVDTTIKNNYFGDVRVEIMQGGNQKIKNADTILEFQNKSSWLKDEIISDRLITRRLRFTGNLKKDEFSRELDMTALIFDKDHLYVYPYSDVKDNFKAEGELKAGEAYYFTLKKEVDEELKLLGINIKLKKANPNIWLNSTNAAQENIGIIVNDEDFAKFDALLEDTSIDGYKELIAAYTFTEKDRDAKIELGDKLIEDFRNYPGHDGAMSSLNSAEMAREIFAIYGSVLYCGILMGLIFLATTIMIVFYKQISEGFEDKKRFEILKRVGLQKSEISALIRKQIVWVFLMPLLVAVIHASASIDIVGKVFTILGLSNVERYKTLCLLTYLVYSVIYLFIYLISSRSYYSLVSNEAKG